MRHSRIVSPLWECALLEGRDGFVEEDDGVRTNALPSLLAACTPSTELSLFVKARQGKPTTPSSMKDYT